MRCPRRLPKTMLAAILAVGIAFPAPALAFADDAADANKSAGESAVDTTAISEGATQDNDPALFDELVEGVDYRGLLVTLDEDSKINLLSADGGESELAQGLADAGLAVTNQIESADGSTLAVADVADDMRASEAVAAAQEVPGVVSVQPNFVYRLVDEVPAGALDESAASIADEQVEGDEGISAQALGMPNDDYVIHPRSERTLQPILALHHAHYKSVEPRACGQHRHRSHTRHGRGFRPCGSGRQPAYGLRVGCVQQQAAERERA